MQPIFTGSQIKEFLVTLCVNEENLVQQFYDQKMAMLTISVRLWVIRTKR